MSQATFEADPSLLPSLPMALVVSHYEEDLNWLRYQPHPAIVYEKKTPRGLSGEAAQGLRDYPSLVNHDPFDRALLASAASFGVPFITSDSKILDLQLPFVIDACD